MVTIDLNCDMGETPGNQPGSTDQQLLPYVTSANIACGFHAGDPLRMQITVQAALREGVAIGAHPGLYDRRGFGRRERPVSPSEVYQLTLYQIGALAAFVQAAGGRLHHVKPHGALYNMAAHDSKLAAAIVAATIDFDPNLILYALAHSEMIREARKRGLSVAAEGFVDRAYQPDGSLLPRTHPNAVLADIPSIVDQSLLLSKSVDTLCVHSDSINAIAIARSLRQAFTENGILVKALSK